MWFVFALLSAIFAALTSILAKIGIEGVNSNLATAIRTVVVVAMAWSICYKQKELDFPNIIRLGHRCILVMLLQGFTAW